MSQPTPNQPQQGNNNPAPKPTSKKKNQKPKIDKLTLDQMEKLIKETAEQVANSIQALAVSPKDDNGREILPLVDPLGKTRKASQQFRSEFKSQMKTYTSMTPEDTIADAIDNKLASIRKTLKDVHEEIVNLPELWDTAVTTLEEQRILYANSDAIDVKIQEEEERIAREQERLAGLKAAKEAAGKRRK